jgi:hypothetical protein
MCPAASDLKSQQLESQYQNRASRDDEAGETNQRGNHRLKQFKTGQRGSTDQGGNISEKLTIRASTRSLCDLYCETNRLGFTRGRNAWPLAGPGQPALRFGDPLGHSRSFVHH